MNREAPTPHSAAWRTSTYSSNQGGSCVEAAPLEAHVGVRDSKDLTLGHLELQPATWSALITGIKSGAS